MNRIYDVGSNNGNWTAANLQKYPNAEFILVEANPSLAQQLNERFKGSPNVKIIHGCVSDRSGEEIKFYIPSKAPYGLNPDTISTASVKWRNSSRFSGVYDKSITLISTTISDILREHGPSDYLKIDVEGYEVVVLKGIQEYVGMLSFEWAEECKEDIIESIKHLNSINYKQFAVVNGDSYAYIPTEFLTFDQTLTLLINSLEPLRMTAWGMIFAK